MYADGSISFIQSPAIASRAQRGTEVASSAEMLRTEPASRGSTKLKLASSFARINATISAQSQAAILGRLIAKESPIDQKASPNNTEEAPTGQMAPAQEQDQKEMAALPYLTWRTLPFSEKERIRLSSQVQFLDQMKPDLSDSRDFEIDLATVKKFLLHAAVSNDIYADSPFMDLLPQGWHRMSDAQVDTIFDGKLDMLRDSESGLFSALYTNGTETICVNRGSMPTKRGHWIQNARQAFGFDTPIYDRAITNANMIADRIPLQNLSFAGHSLGGGLASTQCIAVDGNSPAFTFNPSGVHKGTFDRAGMADGRKDDQLPIVDYKTEGCALTELQKFVPVIPDSIGIRVNIQPHKSGDDVDGDIAGIPSSTPVFKSPTRGIDHHTIPYATDCVVTKFAEKYPEVREAHAEFRAQQQKLAAD